MEGGGGGGGEEGREEQNERDWGEERRVRKNRKIKC
jgi:hypothetical protein